MLTDTFILWRHYLKKGPGVNVSRSVHLYSRIAYIWWIIAFITGGLLVAISKMHKKKIKYLTTASCVHFISVDMKNQLFLLPIN